MRDERESLTVGCPESKTIKDIVMNTENRKIELYIQHKIALVDNQDPRQKIHVLQTKLFLFGIVEQLMILVQVNCQRH